MSDAQEIIEAFREEASVQQIDGTLYAVGSQRQIVDVEDYVDKRLPQPRRKKGTYSVHDAASFCAYLATHGTADSEVWADFPAATVTGVLNAHNAEPQWEDHRVIYKVLHTDAWKAWLAHDGQLLDQAAFAEHIEDRSIDIVKPSAADMLEIAQAFHASTNVTYESGTRLADGQRQLRYREEVDAKAGRAKDMTIPEVFTLGLIPFEGASPYKVTARLRYRILDGHLRIGYRLDRPNDVLREAFGEVVEQIAADSIAPVLRGSRT